MIGEHRTQTHGPCVQNAFMAEVTETGMPVDYFNTFPDEDLPQQREG